MADGTLKVGTITNSAGSGNITIGSGVTLLSNTPAFEAYHSSVQTISDGSTVKVSFDTEKFDTDSTYDASTSKFTPGVSGKYVIYTSINFLSDTSDKIEHCQIKIYKNGSPEASADSLLCSTGNVSRFHPFFSAVVESNTTDYFEIYVYLNVNSGDAKINSISNNRYPTFGAYRIGA